MVVPTIDLIHPSWIDALRLSGRGTAIEGRTAWRLHSDGCARIWGAPAGAALPVRVEPWRSLCRLEPDALGRHVRRAFDWAAGRHDADGLPELGRTLSRQALSALGGLPDHDAAAVFALAAADRAGAGTAFCLALRFDLHLYRTRLPGCVEAMTDAERRLGARVLHAVVSGFATPTSAEASS